MADDWNYDSKTGRYYRYYTKDGQEYSEWAPEESQDAGSYSNVATNRGSDQRARRNSHATSSSRPATATSKSQTRRETGSTTGTRDTYRKEDIYYGSDSKRNAQSSKYHDAAGYGTSHRSADYGPPPPGTYDSHTTHDWASNTSITNQLSNRFRAVSISDETAYTTDSPVPVSTSLAPDNIHSSSATSYAIPTTGYDTSVGHHDNKGKGPQLLAQQPDASPQKDHRYVAATPGNSEKLDRSYQVRNRDYKKFFKTGRVFQTLWTEPYTGPNDTFVSYVTLGQKAYSKVRRFVVVREGDRCCWCLPVTSYDGKGHTKRDIKLSEHCYIYSHKAPESVQGMDFTPLKIELSKGGEKLTKNSLVNYGKLYTVETNVKVKDVGDLDSNSKTILRRCFKIVSLGDDENSKQPILDSTPRSKEADLAGVGAGMSGSAYGYQAVSQPALYAPLTTGPSIVQYNSYGEQSSSSLYPQSDYPTTGSYAPDNYATASPASGNSYPSSSYPSMATVSVTSSHHPTVGDRSSFFPGNPNNLTYGSSYTQSDNPSYAQATHAPYSSDPRYASNLSYDHNQQSNEPYPSGTYDTQSRDTRVPRSQHSSSAYEQGNYATNEPGDIDLHNTDEMRRVQQSTSKGSKSHHGKHRR